MPARLWTKGNPSALLVGMQTGAATVENSMEFPQKTKNGTAFSFIFNPAFVVNALGHRWQTQGPQAESGPPPCFILPSTLFLPGSRAELLLNC